MSNVIDERVVKMEFDNSDFDKNINASQKSLNAFNDYLEKSSKESGGYFERIGDTANKMDFSGLVNSVQNISSHFNVLGVVAKRVLEDITDKAYAAGSQFIRSLTVQDVASGWEKYEQKTTGVMTIMAATGKTVDEVNRSLEKLNWYTDETSYNFTDMVTNIGKFTAAGVDLNEAISAMTGIGNLASVSGQGVQQASRAMYNFAQAMGTGTVKVQDWMSIENANMATMEFKQTIIDTALELGTIRETAEGVYETVDKGNEFTVESFREVLKDGWFTSDVLVKTLGKYSEYSDAIYEISDQFDTCSEAMANFNGEGMALGEKAFKAAQEAKTLGEALDSVHDAVSTGWMQTFEYLFGNYEESKKMWTDLANSLWDLFAEPGTVRNEFLADIMTSKWDKLKNAVVDTGVSMEEYDEAVFKSINHTMEMEASFQAYQEAIQNGTIDASTTLEDFRENFEYTGQTIEEMAKEYGSLQDALSSLGYDAVEGLCQGIFELEKASLDSAYGSENMQKYMDEYVKKAKEAYEATGDYTSALELMSSKYGYSAISLFEFMSIVTGAKTEYDQLSIGTKKQIIYQDHANDAFDKFAETCKKASKETDNLEDAMKMLSDAGYDGMTTHLLYNKVLNGSVKSFKDLSQAEKDAIIWTDESAEALSDLSDKIENGDEEINSLLDNIFKQDVRDSVVMGLTSMMQSFVDLVMTARKVWRETVPGLDPDKIVDAAIAFREWAESLTLSEEQNLKFENSVKGLATVVVIIKQVFDALMIPIKSLIERFTGHSGLNFSILDTTSSIADAIIKFSEWLQETNILEEKMQDFTNTMNGVIDVFVDLYNTIKEKYLNGSSPLEAIKESITELTQSLTENSEDVENSAVTKIIILICTVFSTLLEALGKVADGITKFWPIISNFFLEFIDFIIKAFEEFDWEQSAKNLTAIPKAIGEFFKVMTGHSDKDWRTAYPGLAAIVDGLATFGNLSLTAAKNTFDTIKDILGKFIAWVTEKFGDMTPENMAVIAFAAAMIYMIINLGKLAGAAAGILTGFKTFSDNLKKAFGSFRDGVNFSLFGKKDDLSDKIVKVGLVLSLLMGMVLALSGESPANLYKAVGVLAALSVVILATVAVFHVIDNKLSKEKDQINKVKDVLVGISIAILAMAAAVLIISKALNGISTTGKLDKGVYATLASVLVVVGVFAAISVVLTKYAGDFKDAIVVAIVLMSLSSALSKLITVMTQLSSNQYDSIYNSLSSILLIMATFALLAMMASGIKFGSALALVMIASLIEVIMNKFQELGSQLNNPALIAVSDSLMTLMGIVSITAILLGYFATQMDKEVKMDKLSTIITSVGKALVLMAISFAILAKTDVSWQTAITVVGMMTYLVGVIGALLLGIVTLDGIMKEGDLGEISKNVASAIFKIALAMIVVSGAVAILSDISSKGKGNYAAAIIGLMFIGKMVQGLMVASKFSEKANTKAILSLLFGLSMIMSALAILTPLVSTHGVAFTVAGLVLIGVMVMLGLVLEKMSNIPNGAAPILSLLGIIIGLVGALYILSDMPDPFKLLTSFGVLTILMFAIAKCIEMISKKGSTYTGAQKSMLAMSVMIGSIALSLSLLALVLKDYDVNKFIAFTVIFGIFIAAMSIVLDQMKTRLKSSKAAAEALKEMGEAILMMGIGLGALAYLSKDITLEQALMDAVLMGATIIAMTEALKRVKNYSSDGNAIIKSIAGLSLALVAVAGVFYILNHIGIGGKRTLAYCAGILLALFGVAMVVDRLGDIVTNIEPKVKKTEKAKTDFEGLAKFSLAMAASLAVAVGAMIALEKLGGGVNWGTVGAIVASILAIGMAMFLITQNAEGLDKAFKPLIVMAVAATLMGGIFIALEAIKADPGNVGMNALSLIGAILVLASGLAIIAESGANLSYVEEPLMAMILAVAVIGGILIALAAIKADPKILAVSVISIAALLMEMQFILSFLADEGSKLQNAVKPLMAMAVAVVAIGTVLAILAGIKAQPESLLMSTGVIMILLLEISILLQQMASKGAKIKNAVTPLLSMSVAIAAIGLVLGLLAAITTENKISTLITSGVVIAALLGVVSFALYEIADRGAKLKNVIEPLKYMALAVGVIGSVLAALVALSTDPAMLLGISVVLVGVIGALMYIFYLISESKTNYTKVEQNINIMISTVGSMGAILALLLLIGVGAGSLIGIASSISLAILALAAGLEAIGKYGDSITKSGPAMGIILTAVIVAGAVLIALSKMEGYDFGKILGAAIGIGIVVAIAGLALGLITKFAGEASASTSLIAGIITAIALAGGAIALISAAAGNNWETVGMAAVGIGAVLLAAAAALAVVSLLGKDVNGSISAIGVIAAGVAAAAIAIGVLSRVSDPESLMGAALGLIGVILAMSIALMIASLAGDNAVKGGAALAIMSIALLAAAGSVSMLAGYDWQNLLAAAGSLVGVVLLMAVAALIASKGVVGAVALSVLCAAVSLVAVALGSLAQIDSDKLIIAAATIAVFMLVLVGVGYLAGGAAIGITTIIGAIQGLAGAILMISASSVLLGAGMTLIANSLIMLGKVDILKVINNLLALAAALPILIMALAKSVTANAAGIVQAIVDLIGIVLQAIIELAPQIVEVITTIIGSLLDQADELLPKFIDLVSDIIVGILKALRDITPQLIAYVTETVIELIRAFNRVSPEVMNAIGKFILDFLDTVKRYTPDIIRTGCDIVIEFIEGITEKLPDIIKAGTDLIIALLEGIGESTAEIAVAAWDTAIAFIQALADALNDEERQEEAYTAISDLITGLFNMAVSVIAGFGNGFWTAAWDLISKLLEGIEDRWLAVKTWFKTKFAGKETEGSIAWYVAQAWEKMKEAGAYLIEGLMEGIKSLAGDVGGNIAYSAVGGPLGLMFKIGQGCVNAFKAGSDEASPSKAMKIAGRFLIEGAEIGIEEEAPNALNTMYDIGKSMVDTFADSTKSMAEVVGQELSDGIVIKPVVDLSNVEDSTGEINSMFTGMALNFDNVNFGGTTAGLTGKIAYSQAKAAEVQNGSSNETSNNSTVTFNQYNTSPKALSRYEIYRQTENQLAMMKGLVAQ